MFDDLRGKVALITGGRRGIGRAIALGLLDSGATVHVAAKSAWRGDLPRELSYWQRDLYFQDKRDGLIDSILEYSPCKIDILINNAGCQHLAPALEFPQEDFDYDMQVMVNAAFDLSCQAARYMKDRDGGRIINISSISGVRGVRNAVSYSVAKHAIIGLTRALACEWAPYGINVNAILPGFIETDMLKPLTDDPQHAAEVMGRIPKGRFGKPEDLVGTALWLCSSASEYVTGGLFPVDGGWLVR